MVSLRVAASVYNIILPDHLSEDCDEFNEYNKTYNLLKTNNKIKVPLELEKYTQFVDTARFKQIYQPVYNRALIVVDKYPFTQRAILDNALSLKAFMENTLQSVERSSQVHYCGRSKDIIQPIQNANEYLMEHHDKKTNSISYSGDIYFGIYSDRLFEYLYETPDVYDRFVRTNNAELCGIMCGNYNTHKRRNVVNLSNDECCNSETDEEINIEDFMADL
jgi:hypothetical protein